MHTETYQKNKEIVPFHLHFFANGTAPKVASGIFIYLHFKQ